MIILIIYISSLISFLFKFKIIPKIVYKRNGKKYSKVKTKRKILKKCFLHKKLVTLKKVKDKNLHFVSRTMQSAMGHVSGDVESVKYVFVNCKT